MKSVSHLATLGGRDTYFYSPPLTDPIGSEGQTGIDRIPVFPSITYMYVIYLF